MRARAGSADPSGDDKTTAPILLELIFSGSAAND
jgi:hypothetical protein